MRREPGLWLSRSWTTRAQRPGEPDDAYVFVDRAAFETRIRTGGFLEWTEFLDSYYGTPTPEPPPGEDVVLEIELHGAQQVRAIDPDAIVIFVMPPSRAEQERRLRRRGDDPERVARRLAKAEEEEPIGLALADHVVVNDDLDRAVGELRAIIAEHRSGHSDSP
jgi:guanylate kinase